MFFCVSQFFINCKKSLSSFEDEITVEVNACISLAESDYTPNLNEEVLLLYWLDIVASSSDFRTGIKNYPTIPTSPDVGVKKWKCYTNGVTGSGVVSQIIKKILVSQEVACSIHIAVENKTLDSIIN